MVAALKLLAIISCNLIVITGKECRTRFGVGPPCIFPFRFQGELFYECTSKYLTNSTDAMCPTKLVDDFTREASLEREDWGFCFRTCDLLHYRTTEELHDKIQYLSSQYSDLAVPFVLGTSVKGTPLMGIRITRNVRAPRDLLKPMVRLVANIHGNEPVGREVIVHFAYHLLSLYDKDETIKQLVDTTDISLVPTINPDGFKRAKAGQCSGSGKRAGAYNENNVDLNKDFPNLEDWYRFQKDLDFDVYQGRQPETEAMIHWSATNPFVLSANMGDGAVLVTYPFDFEEAEKSIEENETEDKDLFVHLAKNYVDRHPTMNNNTKCFRRSDRGYDNGAWWYSRNVGGRRGGSLKDFSYMFTNNLELSLEMSCCKYPGRYFLIREWESNKLSLINFLQQVHQGIKGVVFGPNGNPAEGADIVVWNPDGSRRGKNVTSFSTGEYWKFVLPGKRVNTGESTYKIQAFYDDCEVTGRRYASLQHKLIVSERTPLAVKNMYMRHVGFCGVEQRRDNQNILPEIQTLIQNKINTQAATPRQLSEQAQNDYYYQNYGTDENLEDIIFEYDEDFS